MHDVTSPPDPLRIAIAPGVVSPHLSALLALQRTDEPDVALAFFEVTVDDLVTGLREGRYDVGVSLQGSSAPVLRTHALWTESMAVVASPQSPLLAREELILTDLLEYPLYRWPTEACSALDRRLNFLPLVDQKHVRRVTSFEMLAMWVAAGYGVGVTAKSRVEQASGWRNKMRIRSLADGPYEIVTHLLRRQGPADSAAERFESRALQIARGASA